MKKILIKLVVPVVIIGICGGFCYLRHVNPLQEISKIGRVKRVDIFAVVIPFIGLLAILYFNLFVDWDILLQQETATEVVDNKGEEKDSFLQSNDHREESRLAEEKLFELTSRRIETAPELEQQKAPEKVEANEQSVDVAFFAELNNKIKETGSGSHTDEEGNEDNDQSDKEASQDASLSTAGEAKEIGVAVPVSYEQVITQPESMASNLYHSNADSKKKPESQQSEFKTEISAIAEKLPDPLNDLVTYNLKSILDGNQAMDEVDRLDIIKYLKAEKGFTGSTAELSKKIITRLNELGKENVSKQVVAGLLTTDNSLMITEKKTNNHKQRNKNYLKQFADTQQGLFSN